MVPPYTLIPFGLSAGMLIALIILAVWEMIWKGIALWHSARNNQMGWFVPIVIFNTAGILPIIYMAFFKGKKKKRR